MGGGYRIETIYGSGKFSAFSDLFPEGKVPESLKLGLCYSNSIGLAFSLDANNKRHDCSVVTGICKMPSLLGNKESHFSHLHAVTAFTGKKSGERLIADFTYNVVMSEELYYKLFNFEILSEVKVSKIKEALNFYSDHREAIKGRLKSPRYWGTDREMLLGEDDFLDYYKGIVNGTCEPFRFVHEDDFAKTRNKSTNEEGLEK